jgi:putative ubiquitin-RnfH superfamily antitoxin RatB of RatAB toxin-antitoxin module
MALSMLLCAGRKLCMGAAESLLSVDVVYAWPGEQVVVGVQLPRGSTIQDAIDLSGIARQFPEINLVAGKVGVFGKRRAPSTPLRDGDRVEIYRPLLIDPKDARHARVRPGKPRDKG